MISYTVSHPDGNFFWCKFNSYVLNWHWRQVVEAIPDDDWRTLCRSLLRVTDEGHWEWEKSLAVTGLDPCGAYCVRLSPRLACLPENVAQGAVAHELAHVLLDHGRQAKADILREEFQADEQARAWGFEIDGLARTVREQLAAGTLDAKYR